jgi:cyclohexyl-isocyanide hydratase
MQRTELTFVLLLDSGKIFVSFLSADFYTMVKIGMVLFTGMTQLDLTGPLEVFTRFPDTTVHLVSITKDPVICDRGLTIVPDTTFVDCPDRLTVLFVPGGPGVSGVLADERYLMFIRSRAHADYITSVCTGSIILAACGLLTGFRATTHWLSLELLERFDIKVENARVVIDRNRITGAGVTSGIDFALTLGSKLFGESIAKEIQLMIEYDPKPPFESGTPYLAGPSLVKKVVEQRVAAQQKRLEEIDKFISGHAKTSH